MLNARKETGKEINEVEYKRLCEIFSVLNNTLRSGYMDIKSGDYSDRVRRWATLLNTRNILKRLILFRKRVETHVNKTIDQSLDVPEGPVLTADDLFLALFPVPKSPLLLPWHCNTNIDNAFNWVRSMFRWYHTNNVANNRGDLALSVHDLLAGKKWKPEGPYGLTNSERMVLRGFALEDSDLREADWRAHPGANLVLWGSQ